MFGLSLPHLIIILVIIVLIFGTKKLKNIGQDLGSAVKGFKDGMKDGTTDNKAETPETAHTSAQVTGPDKRPVGETIDVETKTPH